MIRKTHLLAVMLMMSYTLFSQSKKEYKAILKEFNSDIVKVPSGLYVTRGLGDEFVITPKDSNLLFSATTEEIVNIKEFFLSNHEVTNAEYGEFVRWVKDSIIASSSTNFSKEELYYKYAYEGVLDSVNVVRDVFKLMNNSKWYTSRLYFFQEEIIKVSESPNFPVVGVSFYQAKAYCHWKTNRINKEMGFTQKINLRLPTQHEWEYAFSLEKLKNNDSNYYNHSLFTWSIAEDETFKEVANYGRVCNQNGYIIKWTNRDGYQNTSPVKSYPPNQIGLYDMCGNVSEWTSSEIQRDSVESLIKRWYIYWLSDVDEPLLSEFTTANPDYDYLDSVAQDAKDVIYLMRSRYKEVHNHDLLVLSKNKNNVIVKGGSYMDSLLYLMIGAREVYSKENSSLKIGFRIALDFVVKEDE